MGLRIILGIFLDATWVSSRMLQDGSRIAQDGFKDHPGDLVVNAAWVSSRMLQDGSRMAQDGFKDHPGIWWWMRRE